jgi:arylsulfatase A-like enzyme
MVTSIDDAVGEILAAIDAKGMGQSTLVVFASDNGGLPVRGASNHPLRGRKSTLYEGGVRVPCVARFPGQLPASAIIEAPLHMTDWYPTLLRLAGATLDQPRPIDGKDLWPVLTQGAPSPHEEILLNVDDTIGAIRRGRWKLIRNEPTRPAPEQRIELFDLESDPGETKNLADEQPRVVADLVARLDAYVAQAAVPLQVVTGDKRLRELDLPKAIGVADP